MLFNGAATGQHIVIRANGMQIVNANGVRQPTRNQPKLFNVAAAANQHVHTPLHKTQTHGQTTYHTQNVPGARNDTPNIAVIDITGKRKNAVPRSFFSATGSSGDRFNPTQYKNVFDKDTLQSIFMTLQQTFTGGFHAIGPEFLTSCIQNGHEFKRETEGLSAEEAIKKADKPMIAYIPEETPEGAIIQDLWSFFTADMHVPYAGTSGNIQATGIQNSDRVEELDDDESQPTQKEADVEIIVGSGGVHRSGSTIGGGEGGVHVKTTDGGNITAESQTRRDYAQNGHADSIAVSDLTEGTGNVTEESDGHIFYQGAVEHEAGKGTNDPSKKLTIRGKKGVYSVETTLEKGSIEHVSNDKVMGTITEIRTAPVTKKNKSSGTAEIESTEGKVSITAAAYDAPGGTTIRGRDGVTLPEAHRTYARTEDLHKEGNGITTQSKSFQHSVSEANSVITQVIRGPLHIQSKEDITIHGISVGDLTLETEKIARILLGTNTRSEQTVIKGKSMIHQSVSIHQEHHETFTESQIQNLTVTSLETIVESVRGRIPEFMNRIKQDGGKLTQSFIDEVHEVIDFHHETLNPECMAVLGLGVSLATYGTCSWIGGYVAGAGTVGATATTAALSALTSKAIVTLANNKMNVNKTLDDITTLETLKEMTIAAGSAATVHHVGGRLGIGRSGKEVNDLAKAKTAGDVKNGVTGTLNIHRFTGQVAYQGLVQSTNIAFQTTLGGRKFEDLLKAGGVAGAAAIVGGFAANTIGDARSNGDITLAGQGALHFAQGTMQGVILGGTPRSMLVAGASAAGVELVAERIMPTGPDARTRGVAPSEDAIRVTHNVAKMAAAVGAWLSGVKEKELGIGIIVGATTLENNHGLGARRLKGTGLTVIEEGEEDAEDGSKEKDRTISFQVKGREGKAPKLDLKALQEYQGDLRCLTPRSYAAVLEYQSCLAFNAKQPDDVHGLFRPLDEVDTKLSFDPLSRAESAYVSAQSKLGSAANEKHKQGDTLSDYERTVRRDARRENQRFWKQTGGRVVAVGVGAASLPVAAAVGMTAVGTATVAGIIGGAASVLDTYASHDYDVSDISGLEWGLSASVGAALSAVPGYKGANASAATKGSITLQNAANVGKSGASTTAAESRIAANLNPSLPRAANTDRMPIPYFASEASEVNCIQGLAQQHIRGSGAAGTTIHMSGTGKPLIPNKYSIIMYGHKKDSTGKLVEAAIAIKGKEGGVLHLTQPKKGLFETANEASAAYARVRAGMASPTSVASGGVNVNLGRAMGPAPPSVRWVDERAGMSTKARYYNDSVSGASSNPATQKGLAPSLEFTASDGKTKVVRFDGIENSVLIDRKISIVTTDKVRNQALRQSEALTQNNLTARWEVPDQTQFNRAQKMLSDLKISNIKVSIVDVPTL